MLDHDTHRSTPSQAIPAAAPVRDLPGGDLPDLSATELVRRYAEGSLSPVEVHDAVQERIEAVEPTLCALYAPNRELSARLARESERRWRAGEPCGPIDGVPLTLKENIATKGVPLPAGSAATQLVPATEDGPSAALALGAGGVLLAKTTMPDVGMLSSGLSSFHQLARNPWNPAWNPGGSSAGAATACAAGYGPLHVGTDIGGSLRLPACWTATVSLKPSFGRVPVDPPYYGRVLGPITRSAADAALFMSVLAHPDPRDHMGLPPNDIAWGDLETDMSGKRVALLLDAGSGLPVEPEIRAAVSEAAAVFERAGVHVEPIEPFFGPEQLHDLDLFWRVRGWEWFAQLSHDRQHAVLPYIADWCRGGADVPGVVLMRCVNRMMEISATCTRATAGYDLVLSPVSPVSTFPAEWPSPTNDVTHALEHISFTAPYNFSGQPASSVNCGWTAEGKSIGLQIAGPRFDDLGVLRATRWFEQARPARLSPQWPPPALSDYAGTGPWTAS